MENFADVQAGKDRVGMDTRTGEPDVEQASQPFVGRWNHLVSTTNWEKGRIITEWRESLEARGAPATEYSDEAWARRVGGVTGQHVGRLRRVYQRFGKVYQEYEGLYWSHFHAALDWDDAEMWLEGALQSGWSVSQMRRQRWEALGSLADQQPCDEEIIVAERDEDFEPAVDQAPMVSPAEMDRAESSPAEGPCTERAAPEAVSPEEAVPSGVHVDPEPTAPLVRPFEHLGELPTDLTEAFDAFKLAILRHKADGWREVACEDVLAALDALKQLALAPSTE